MAYENNEEAKVVENPCRKNNKKTMMDSMPKINGNKVGKNCSMTGTEINRHRIPPIDLGKSIKTGNLELRFRILMNAYIEQIKEPKYLSNVCIILNNKKANIERLR